MLVKVPAISCVQGCSARVGPATIYDSAKDGLGLNHWCAKVRHDCLWGISTRLASRKPYPAGQVRRWSCGAGRIVAEVRTYADQAATHQDVRRSDGGRQDDLADCMDRIGQKYGRHTLYLGAMWGAQGSAPTRISLCTQIPTIEECV
jgi:hypothetical protein